MLTTHFTPTTTTNTSQQSSIHQPKQASMSFISDYGQLSATAHPFDPTGFVSVEDKQFALFQQLQDINNQMQQLHLQLNSVSIPTLTQMNDQMLRLAPYYTSNPTYYIQCQQQQIILFQTVQQQQQQYRILEQNRNKLQTEYQQTKDEIQQQTSVEGAVHSTTLYINPPQHNNEQTSITEGNTTIMEPTTPASVSTLSMIIEDAEIDDMDETDDEDDDDVVSSESPEYQLTSSMMDTIIESNDADDHAYEPKAWSVDPISYPMSDLSRLQKEFVDINWRQCPNIPQEIRFIGTDFDRKTFITDVLAMISRRCTERFSDRKALASDDIKRQQMKKLKGILNKMTPTKFTKIAAETMVIISDYAQCKDELEDVLMLILEFGTRQNMFSWQYAQLIQHLFSYLPRLVIKCDYEWIKNDDELSKTFRRMVIVQSHKLFYQYRNDMHSVINSDIECDAELIQRRKGKQKKTFIDFLKLCGDLYNVDMMKSGVIYKGIIDELLPPKNSKVSEVDIEGICGLFKQCGEKLDEENTAKVDVYLSKIGYLSSRFDFRTRCLVDGIKEMRLKDWTHRIKKEKPKELDEVKKEFDEEQQRKAITINKKRTQSYDDNTSEYGQYYGYKGESKRRSRYAYEDAYNYYGDKTYYDDRERGRQSGQARHRRDVERDYGCGHYESGYDDANSEYRGSTRYYASDTRVGYHSYNRRSRCNGYHSSRHGSYGNY